MIVRNTPMGKGLEQYVTQGPKGLVVNMILTVSLAKGSLF